MYLSFTPVIQSPVWPCFSPPAKLLSNGKEFILTFGYNYDALILKNTSAISIHVSRNPLTHLILLILVDKCTYFSFPLYNLLSGHV